MKEGMEQREDEDAMNGDECRIKVRAQFHIYYGHRLHIYRGPKLHIYRGPKLYIYRGPQFHIYRDNTVS